MFQRSIHSTPCSVVNHTLLCTLMFLSQCVQRVEHYFITVCSHWRQFSRKIEPIKVSNVHVQRGWESLRDIVQGSFKWKATPESVKSSTHKTSRTYGTINQCNCYHSLQQFIKQLKQSNFRKMYSWTPLSNDNSLLKRFQVSPHFVISIDKNSALL